LGGTEDFALLRRLDEDDETRRAGEVFEIELAGGVEVDETADDGHVGELAAGVFAAGDGGGSGVGGEGGDEGCLRRDGSRYAAFEATVTSFEVSDGESDLGPGGRLAGGGEELGRVAADELGLAMDNGLGGVDAVEGEALAVALLAGGEGGGGVGVGPAEAIPVVDVLTEDEEFNAGDGLLIELSQDAVGGGATGAALGGEELYEDGYGEQ